MYLEMYTFSHLVLSVSQSQVLHQRKQDLSHMVLSVALFQLETVSGSDGCETTAARPLSSETLILVMALSSTQQPTIKVDRHKCRMRCSL